MAGASSAWAPRWACSPRGPPRRRLGPARGNLGTEAHAPSKLGAGRGGAWRFGVMRATTPCTRGSGGVRVAARRWRKSACTSRPPGSVGRRGGDCGRGRCRGCGEAATTLAPCGSGVAGVAGRRRRQEPIAPVGHRGLGWAAGRRLWPGALPRSEEARRRPHAPRASGWRGARGGAAVAQNPMHQSCTGPRSGGGAATVAGPLPRVGDARNDPIHPEDQMRRAWRRDGGARAHAPVGHRGPVGRRGGDCGRGRCRGWGMHARTPCTPSIGVRGAWQRGVAQDVLAETCAEAHAPVPSLGAQPPRPQPIPRGGFPRRGMPHATQANTNAPTRTVRGNLRSPCCC